LAPSSADTLKEYFSQYGELKEAVVMKDAGTKRSRGFGFVVFAKRRTLDALLATSRTFVIDGRSVRVTRASACRRTVA
jgi:RNA-binding protein Musashi